MAAKRKPTEADFYDVLTQDELVLIRDYLEQERPWMAVAIVVRSGRFKIVDAQKFLEGVADQMEARP
jgi:hypothetical protein